MNKGDYVKVFGYLVKFSDDFDFIPYFVDGTVAKIIEVDDEQLTIRCMEPTRHERSIYGQSFVVHRMQCRPCDSLMTVETEF